MHLAVPQDSPIRPGRTCSQLQRNDGLNSRPEMNCKDSVCAVISLYLDISSDYAVF